MAYNNYNPNSPQGAPQYYHQSPQQRPQYAQQQHQSPRPPNYAPPQNNSGYSPQQNYVQQGGYPPQTQGYPPPPPPKSASPLWNWFKAVDTDGSGQLSVDELQRALVNGDWSPFNIETVRMMVNMFDADNTGTIDFQEFEGLWKYIEDWKQCFQAFDADGSGSIDRTELQNALKTFGYNLSPGMVAQLIQKFDKYGRGDVTFDNFVQACVTVKTLTDSFRRFDTNNTGSINIQYEQFLELVIRQR